MSENLPGPIATRFEEMQGQRWTAIERGKQLSAATIPTLMPPSGFNNTNYLPDLYSSVPARGVTSLGARMTSALYPLNGLPFFQHTLNMEYVPEGVDPTEAEAALARLDRTIMNKLSETNLRQELFTMFQHLIVLGDALIHCSDDYQFRVIRIDQYVVRRKPTGEVCEIIIRDFADRREDPEYFGTVASNPYNSNYGAAEPINPDLEAVFTRVCYKDDGLWHLQREVAGQIVDTGEYEVNPYMPVSWNRIVGEDYGRSLVEENIGDIRSLESLSKALIQGCAANSEFRMALDPSAYTTIHDMQETRNGDWVVARPGEVFTLQIDNQIQLNTTNAAREDLTKELARTFLMSSAALPTGERVTATQIREIAQELDQALGGVFSGSARDIQMPIIKRVMLLMTRDGKIDPSIMDMVGQGNVLALEVRTGLAALNREIENSMLSQWASVVGQTPAAQGVNWNNWALRFTQSLGLETKGIIKTPEEIEQEQMGAAQAQLGMEAASAGIQATAKETPQ